MMNIVIRMAHDVGDNGFYDSGILLHRFVPQGRDDAIRLLSGPSTTLMAWIDPKHARPLGELSPPDLGSWNPSEWGVISAPHLSIELALTVSDAVVAGMKNDGEYIELGKQVAKIVHRGIEPLITTLRVDYGQYWLWPVREWDARRSSLGAYFSGLQARWRAADSDDEWRAFRPDSVNIRVTASASSGAVARNFITNADCQTMQSGLPGVQAGISTHLMLRSETLLEEHDDGRLALIEAVSAVEAELAGWRRKVAAFWPTFDDWPVERRFRTIAQLAHAGDEGDIATATRAWGYRNRLLHDGWSPSDAELDQMYESMEAVQRVGLSLMRGRRVRIVTQHPGNVKVPLEKWDEQYNDETHGRWKSAAAQARARG